MYSFNLEVFAEHINYSLTSLLLDVFKRPFPAIRVVWAVNEWIKVGLLKTHVTNEHVTLKLQYLMNIINIILWLTLC